MLDQATFAYDQQAPLALEILTERVQDGAIIRDITYASPHGGKVPAYLIQPSQRPPQAALIFGHWGQGDRNEFLDEAIVLTRLGIGSLCLDAPILRSTSYKPQQTQPQADLQWITDLRRGVDLLLECFSLAPGHVGYVGHSSGATLGGVSAGIEQRISAFVLMAGCYSMSEFMRTSTIPAMTQARSQIPPEVFAIYIDAMAPLDASHYIKDATPSHLLFQFARDDENVLPNDAQKYFDLASEPKQIAWYDNCGHELNIQARIDRAIWLCERLHVERPSQEIIRQLEQIPPPTPLQEG